MRVFARAASDAKGPVAMFLAAWDVATRLLVALIVCAGLFYIALLVEPKDPVEYRLGPVALLRWFELMRGQHEFAAQFFRQRQPEA